MLGHIRPLYLALVPGQGVDVEPPQEWLERARQGLVSDDVFRQFEADVREKLLILEAGQNVVVRTREENGRTVAVLEVMATQNAYVSVEGHALVLDDAHNGKVVEVQTAGMVVTVPAKLRKGFACLVRSVVNGGFNVQPGQGVTFVPVEGLVSVNGMWDEVYIEAAGDGVFLVRKLVS